MMLRNIVKKEVDVPVNALISEGNYTRVIFADGTEVLSGYTKGVVKDHLSCQFKSVRRGVDVNPCIFSANSGRSVSLSNRTFPISRRNLKHWIAMFVIALSSCLSLSKVAGQNTAPVAVNDTLRVCNDIPTYFSVLNNDYDANGDRLRLSSFSAPSSGDLVAATNSGFFRLDWSTAITTPLSFTYQLKDLRFANVGSLASNTATVVLHSAAPYFYTGTYTGTASRLSCRAENSAAASITTTARETHEVYSYFLLDGAKGAVTIEPGVSGVVEFTIKAQ